jgi:sec-independent protein translocase protein TatA
MGLTNPTHLLVLAVIILLVFGSSKLPSIARSAGKHAREAKDGVSSFKQEFDVGENNPLNEVVDTLRSANPKTIVKDAAKKAASPSERPKGPTSKP